MKSSILPKALKPGATIGICSPSGPVQPKKLEAGVKALEARGYRVVLSEAVLERRTYLAGDDDTRLFELHKMFDRSDVDAVFVSRGGYGIGRILSRIHCERIAASRKCFVSFSDLTSLSWLLFARAGLVTFSGPLAVEWGGGVCEEGLEGTLRLLSDTGQRDLFAGFPKDNFRVLRGGACEGVLLPGNLTIITTLLGTPFLPDFSGAILVLEEVVEARYRLDRFLFHLRNAGVFSRIGGLITGDMVYGAPDEKDVPKIEEILLDATAGFDFPILCGVPYGHGTQRATLPVGVHARLDGDSLSLLEPVVEEAIT